MPKKEKYKDVKGKVCDLCERTFSAFNNDYISVHNKTYEEVMKIIDFAKENNSDLKDVNFEKYVYVVEANGDTIIKR